MRKGYGRRTLFHLSPRVADATVGLRSPVKMVMLPMMSLISLDY